MADLNQSFRVPTPAQPAGKDPVAPQSDKGGTAATTKFANPTSDPGNPIGVGSLGDGRKPFNLKG